MVCTAVVRKPSRSNQFSACARPKVYPLRAPSTVHICCMSCTYQSWQRLATQTCLSMCKRPEVYPMLNVSTVYAHYMLLHKRHNHDAQPEAVVSTYRASTLCKLYQSCMYIVSKLYTIFPTNPSIPDSDCRCIQGHFEFLQHQRLDIYCVCFTQQP